MGRRPREDRQAPNRGSNTRADFRYSESRKQYKSRFSLLLIIEPARGSRVAHPKPIGGPHGEVASLSASVRTRPVDGETPARRSSSTESRKQYKSRFSLLQEAWSARDYWASSNAPFRRMSREDAPIHTSNAPGSATHSSFAVL